MDEENEFNLIEEFCKHSAPEFGVRAGAFQAASFLRESSSLVLIEKSTLATGDPWNLRHITLSGEGEIDDLMSLLQEAKRQFKTIPRQKSD